jgi:hypothetical protein
MNLEKLTIILPVQAERPERLAALTAALPPAVSLLLIDSGDGRAADWLETQERERTAVIRQPGSLDEAREQGGRTAATPWLLFTRSHIAFAPNYFARLEGQNSVEMIYGPSLSYEGGRWGWSPLSQKLLAWFNIPLVSTTNMVVSRHAFLALGGFRNHLSYHTFTAFAWRLRRKGHPIRYDANLVVHRPPRF